MVDRSKIGEDGLVASGNKANDEALKKAVEEAARQRQKEQEELRQKTAAEEAARAKQKEQEELKRRDELIKQKAEEEKAINKKLLHEQVPASTKDQLFNKDEDLTGGSEQFDTTDSYANYYKYAKWGVVSVGLPLAAYGASILARICLNQLGSVGESNGAAAGGKGGYVKQMASANERIITSEAIDTNDALSAITTSIKESNKDLLASLRNWQGGDINKLASEIFYHDMLHAQKFASSYWKQIAAALVVSAASAGVYYAYSDEIGVTGTHDKLADEI